MVSESGVRRILRCYRPVSCPVEAISDAVSIKLKADFGIRIIDPDRLCHGRIWYGKGRESIAGCPNKRLIRCGVVKAGN